MQFFAGCVSFLRNTICCEPRIHVSYICSVAQNIYFSHTDRDSGTIGLDLDDNAYVCRRLCVFEGTLGAKRA